MSFFLCMTYIGIPALIVAIAMGVASKDYGDDKM